MRNKKCRGCNENVIGRADKKFCCDLCRTDYYNRLYRNRYADVELVNKKLRRNYLLLLGLLNRNCFRVRLETLCALEFDPKLVTHFDESDQCKYLYDIQIRISLDGWVEMCKDQSIATHK